MGIRPCRDVRDFWCVHCGEECTRCFDSEDFDIGKWYGEVPLFIHRTESLEIIDASFRCTVCNEKTDVILAKVIGVQKRMTHHTKENGRNFVTGPLYYILEWYFDEEAEFAYENCNFAKGHADRAFMSMLDGD